MNAIITGATKGIGRAISVKLAKEGYDLVLCARSEADLNELKQSLQLTGIKVSVIVADLSRKADVKRFCEEAAKQLKTIDILVNNAGVFLPGNLIDEGDDDFEMQQQLNLNAVYYLSKFFGKMMRSQKSGHIFNICSIASVSPAENAGSYSVTKTAMLSLNHVLRKELAAHKVKVTAILPGPTLTASWSGTNISKEKFVQPEDIADSLYAILKLSNGVNVDEITLTPLNF